VIVTLNAVIFKASVSVTVGGVRAAVSAKTSDSSLLPAKASVSRKAESTSEPQVTSKSLIYRLLQP